MKPKKLHEFDALPIRTVVEGTKLHYQTDPYLGDDGKIYVKRLHTYDVNVITVGEVVEEYTAQTSYKEEG